MKKCPNCGNNYPDCADTCPECMLDLASGTAVQSEDNKNVLDSEKTRAEDLKYCPKCKVEYQKWAEKCSDCKVPLVNELPPEPVSENSVDHFSEAVNLCSQCGCPVPEYEKTCLNCQSQQGEYDNLDPLKQIHEQGRIYRKTATGEYDHKSFSPYMSIIFSVFIFLIPAAVGIIATIGVCLYGLKNAIPMEAKVSIILMYILVLIMGFVGIKILMAAIRKIRKH